MLSEAEFRRLINQKARLEQSLKSMEICYQVPVKKLKRLDDLLFQGEKKPSVDIVNSIIKLNLHGATSYIPLIKLCFANDLLLTAQHFAELNMREFGRTRPALLHAAKALEALGDLDAAWRLHEEGNLTREPGLHTLMLAAQLGKWDYLEGFADLPQLAPRLARMRTLAAATRRHAAATPTTALPVFIVNLPDDKYRRMRAERSMARHGIAAQFRRGYKPGEVPAEERSIFRKPLSPVADGSFGNQYAQYQLWKEIAAGPHEAVLILEDDTQFLANPNHVLRDVRLPAGWDIIFANPRLDLSQHEGEWDGACSIRPFEQVFARFSHISPAQDGFGADCYLLSRAGARKLKAIVESEGFHTIGTDWYLQTHCIARHRLEAFNPDSIIAKFTRTRHDRPFHNPLLLSGHVLCPSFAQGQSIGISRSQRI